MVPRRILTAALAATLLLGACAQPEQKQSTDNGHADMGGGAHAGDKVTFGSPADPSQATRTVPVALLDTLRFDPATIEVLEGETITFAVSNPGKAVHEFTLGDSKLQDDHAEEMAATPMTSDTPNSVVVNPGETENLTWKFTERGELLYGCHQAGHYGGGMKGTITVS
jgi:uncharacterized cupredoxin-like copper-binding protein